MKHSKRLTAGGTWLVAAIACGGTKTTPPVDTRGADGASGPPAGADASRLGTSMVRLVNALPDQPKVDLTLDERQTFAAVVYRAGTPYQGVGNNVIQLRLTPAGLPNPLAEMPPADVAATIRTRMIQPAGVAPSKTKARWSVQPYPPWSRQASVCWSFVPYSSSRRLPAE